MRDIWVLGVHQVRAMQDRGSQTAFCTPPLCLWLGLQRMEADTLEPLGVKRIVRDLNPINTCTDGGRVSNHP